jgi:hypothetical protein
LALLSQIAAAHKHESIPARGGFNRRDNGIDCDARPLSKASRGLIADGLAGGERLARVALDALRSGRFFYLSQRSSDDLTQV